MRLSKLAFAAVLVAAPVPAFAHHGWAGQDNDKVTTLQGTIEGGGILDKAGVAD